MKRLYLSITQDIISDIKEGHYPVGTRLPCERELAKKLSVSRVTIREAQIALEAEGYIEKDRSGAFVKRRDISFVSELPEMSAFELTAARAVFEPEAAALAATNITDAGLEELRLLIQAMANSNPETDDSGEDVDKKFHLTIARLSGNAAVEHIIQTLWRIRNEVPQVSSVYAKVCRVDGAARTEEHAAILDALYRRDPPAARSAMRLHFDRLFQEMLTVTENDALEEIKRESRENRQKYLRVTQI
ncbi:FadR/GntR family transcriptional regulator [Parasphingorhabdus halotolerans]|uniref:FadR family transcriptional regulator n=1 Tax=Parasphingorhabdus halotolerans TaxID=2725558 RepID=A0A6H2DQ46_9SPHN|nr:FadR/GntR family transcriptional regulator [Parasphingorhabdus halotolerans]QJB70257.1 FadR family transcriptional regulator [Parasphingorhabdus halotolerans]